MSIIEELVIVRINPQEDHLRLSVEQRSVEPTLTVIKDRAQRCEKCKQADDLRKVCSGNHWIVFGTPSFVYYCIAQFLHLKNRLGFRGRKKILTFAIQKYSSYDLDNTSNSICVGLLVEKVELENALNWLSTLGGAFSALGENDQNFAMKAGKVSKSQLYIAIKLGSPDIMSRCRLYAAISFIQLGKLWEARKILEREYSYAKSLPDGADPRLKRMCIGIWCKLQYEWAKIRQVKTRKR